MLGTRQFALDQLQTFSGFVGPHLPDGQSPHTPHAQIARRANLPHASALATSGKSQRHFRPSRLDEEGRFGRSSRYVRRGAVDAMARETSVAGADGEVVWSWPPDAEAKVAG